MSSTPHRRVARAMCAMTAVLLMAGCSGVSEQPVDPGPTASFTSAAPGESSSTPEPALVAAAERGEWDEVGRLLRVGALDGDPVGRDALAAALSGDGSPPYVDTVRILVAAGADVHAEDRSPLLAAASDADDDPVHRRTAERRLLRAADAGADPSIADRNGVTALQHAERQGHRRVARILRAAG